MSDLDCLVSSVLLEAWQTEDRIKNVPGVQSQQVHALFQEKYAGVLV